MGIVLYRIGDKHTINGWNCDFHVFDPKGFNLDARLEQGWFVTPDCGRTKDDGMQEKEQIETKETEEPQEVIEVTKEITIEYLKTAGWSELRSIAKANNLMRRGMNKESCREVLLKHFGEQNDVQD